VQRGLDLAAIVLVVAVVARSWTRPLFAYDSWAYHLPFAARLHGIGGGADGFVLDPLSAQYFAGFPLLVEWLQGLLWKLCGTPRAVALVDSLAFVTYLVYARRALALRFAPLAFATLAVPMVAIHATSGYIDLVVGCAVAAQAIAGARLLAAVRNAEAPGKGDGAAFLVAAAIAGNAKYMGLALALTIAVYVAIVGWRRGGSRRGRLVALAVTAALLASGWAVRNGVRYGNPVYPVTLRLPLVGIELPGESAPYRKEPDYLSALGPLGHPLGFLLSVTEIDWLVRGVEPDYSIDGASGNRARRFGPAKTGGYCGAYVVALVATLLASRRRRSVTSTGRAVLDRELVRLLGLATVVIALLPQSHDLRFWLGWPLLLVATTLRTWESAADPRARLATPVAALICASSFALLPTAAGLRLLPAWRFDAATIRHGLAPRLLAAIDAGESFCLDASFAPMQFRVSRAFLGGRHVVEEVRRGGECRVLPRLDLTVPPGGRETAETQQR